MKLLTCLVALTGLASVSATVVLAVPTITVSTSLGTTLAALGLLKIKAAALLALSRSKRSADKVRALVLPVSHMRIEPEVVDNYVSHAYLLLRI